MQVFIGNDAVTLDKRTFKGAGGEGAVHKVRAKSGMVGVKVYEKPTRERADKLVAFMRHSHKFTDRIIGPQELVYNSSGMVIGFTMPFVEGDFAEVKKLASRNFRKSYRINSKDVALIFLDGHPTLENIIHKQGFAVGDLSDVNEITIDRKMYFWDVDAWQFDRFPCPVATRDFVDPALYGVDFSLRPVFTPGNDWYSYAVMFFKSLLLVHPYGGTHTNVDNQLERAVRKITVFDRNVTYPTIGIHPDILTDDMLNAFNGYFAKGSRGIFPKRVMEDYLDSLRECTSCGAYFPGNRGNCPVCSARMMVVIQKPSASSRDMDIIEIIRVGGDILAAAQVGDSIKLVVNEKGTIVLYSKDLRNSALPYSKKNLLKDVPGAKFEIGSEYVFVNYPGTDEIFIYSGETAKLLGKIGTSVFAANRRAIFRATNEHLFRIEDDELRVGTLRGGSLEEKTMRKVVDDQTWFWADPNAETPYVFGLFQVLKQQMFWMVKDNRYYDVQVPALEMGETVADLSVRFSSQGVYLLRKTQQGGIDYIRREMVDSSGKVTFSDRIEESKHVSPEIHGLAYSTGQALHATDNGVLHENIKTGATKLFDSTKGYVDGNDSLLRYGPSILAVKQDRVLMITPK
jgi:hypothetical protein